MNFYVSLWMALVKNIDRNFFSRRQEVSSDAFYRPTSASTCRESGKSMDN